MKDDERLKPCPFCGQEHSPMILQFHLPLHNLQAVHYIACNKDNGGCGVTTECYREKEAAIEAWNRRMNND